MTEKHVQLDIRDDVVAHARYIQYIIHLALAELLRQSYGHHQQYSAGR